MEILKKTAEFRIQKQVDGLQSGEVTDISLSGVPLLPELITSYSNLVHLTLVSLKPKPKSLQVIPFTCFPSLRLLNLSDNAIAVPGTLTVEFEGSQISAEQINLGGDTTNTSDPGTVRNKVTSNESSLLVCSSLRRLLLPNNCIAGMEEVKRLVLSFPELEVLDLVDNPIDTPSHFSTIFESFPKLVALNSKDKTGCEVIVEDSDETSDDASGEYEENFEESSDDTDENEDNSSNGAQGSDDSFPRKRSHLE